MERKERERAGGRKDTDRKDEKVSRRGEMERGAEERRE